MRIACVIACLLVCLAGRFAVQKYLPAQKESFPETTQHCPGSPAC